MVFDGKVNLDLQLRKDTQMVQCKYQHKSYCILYGRDNPKYTSNKCFTSCTLWAWLITKF